MEDTVPITSAEGQNNIHIGVEVFEFATALDSCLKVQGSVSEKRSRILKLVDTYYKYALEQYTRTRGRRRLGGRSSGMSVNEGDLDLAMEDDDEARLRLHGERMDWKREAQTWDLLRRLLPTRYPDPISTARAATRRSLSCGASKRLWQDFLASDLVASERKAVLHWLQNSALSSPDIDELVRDLQQDADRGDIVAHGWIHTRAAIKLRKRVMSISRALDPTVPEVAGTLANARNTPLVTQLDPDSIFRQGRKLEPQDCFFDRATWRGCYELLRRGHGSEAIREWCRERTEGWRAVSMSALTLAPPDGGPESEMSPESLALWRRTCISLARQGEANDYERAVYGILSGDVTAVEKVCSTWDDLLFANYNAMIRSQFDSFLLTRCSPEEAASLSQSFLSCDPCPMIGDTTGQNFERRLVRALESHEAMGTEAREPSRVLQASILASDLEGYFFSQGLMLGLQANKNAESKLIPTLGLTGSGLDSRRFYTLNNYRGLRLVAHVYIIVSQLEALCNRATASAISSDPQRALIQQNLVSAYISVARLSGAYALIPVYCSTLDEAKKYESLCGNLIAVTDDSIRVSEISLIRKAGLDPVKFVKFLASSQLASVMELGCSSRQSPTSSFKIMEYGPATLQYGRLVKTDFFGDDPDRVDPMHELLIRSVEWLVLVDEAWPEVLSMATKAYKFFLRNVHLNAARQLVQRVSFIDIVRRRGLEWEEEIENPEFPPTEFWAQQLAMVKSYEVPAEAIEADARSFRELEALVRALDAMETLASLRQLSQEDPGGQRDFWSKVVAEVKAVKEYMSPILGGWLLSGDEELRDIRRCYLPETVLAYVSTLHFAGTYLSRDYLLHSMELAAVIAEKDSDIAACFVECGRMRELVEAFASCSKALAVKTGDKKMTGSTTKKLREMGWTRDLWSVRERGGRD